MPVDPNDIADAQSRGLMPGPYAKADPGDIADALNRGLLKTYSHPDANGGLAYSIMPTDAGNAAAATFTSTVPPVANNNPSDTDVRTLGIKSALSPAANAAYPTLASALEQHQEMIQGLEGAGKFSAPTPANAVPSNTAIPTQAISIPGIPQDAFKNPGLTPPSQWVPANGSVNTDAAGNWYDARGNPILNPTQDRTRLAQELATAKAGATTPNLNIETLKGLPDAAGNVLTHFGQIASDAMADTIGNAIGSRLPGGLKSPAGRWARTAAGDVGGLVGGAAVQMPADIENAGANAFAATLHASAANQDTAAADQSSTKPAARIAAVKAAKVETDAATNLNAENAATGQGYANSFGLTGKSGGFSGSLAQRIGSANYALAGGDSEPWDALANQAKMFTQQHTVQAIANIWMLADGGLALGRRMGPAFLDTMAARAESQARGAALVGDTHAAGAAQNAAAQYTALSAKVKAMSGVEGAVVDGAQRLGGAVKSGIAKLRQPANPAVNDAEPLIHSGNFLPVNPEDNVAPATPASPNPANPPESSYPADIPGDALLHPRNAKELATALQHSMGMPADRAVILAAAWQKVADQSPDPLSADDYFQRLRFGRDEASAEPEPETPASGSESTITGMKVGNDDGEPAAAATPWRPHPSFPDVLTNGTHEIYPQSDGTGYNMWSRDDRESGSFPTIEEAKAAAEGRDEASAEPAAAVSPTQPTMHARAPVDADAVSGKIPEATASAAIGRRAPRRGGSSGGSFPIAEEQPGLTGDKGSAWTARGTQVDYHWSVRDAGDLHTSHTNAFTQTPGYDRELQPRDRTMKATAGQVEKIRQTLQPEIVERSANTTGGAPIIGTDNQVESGNARSMGIRAAYGDNGPRSVAYRKYVIDHAHEFGLDPAEVDKIRNPVLVRVRDTPVEEGVPRHALAKEMGEGTVAPMSESETAVQDAKRIQSSGIAKYAIGNDAGDFTTGPNAQFVSRFLNGLSAAEKHGVLDRNGRLSAAGNRRIRNAVIAAAFDDPGVLERLADSTDDNIRGVGKAIIGSSPRLAQIRQRIAEGSLPDVDITQDIADAANTLSHLRESGRSVPEHLQQMGMFGDDMTPVGKSLLSLYNDYKTRPKQILAVLNAYADAVDRIGDIRQGTAESRDIPSKESLLQGAEEYVDESGNGTLDFVSKESQRPAARANGGRVAQEGAPAADEPGTGSENGNPAAGETDKPGPRFLTQPSDTPQPRTPALTAKEAEDTRKIGDELIKRSAESTSDTLYQNTAHWILPDGRMTGNVHDHMTAFKDAAQDAGVAINNGRPDADAFKRGLIRVAGPHGTLPDITIEHGANVTAAAMKKALSLAHEAKAFMYYDAENPGKVIQGDKRSTALVEMYDAPGVVKAMRNSGSGPSKLEQSAREPAKPRLVPAEIPALDLAAERAKAKESGDLFGGETGTAVPSAQRKPAVAKVKQHGFQFVDESEPKEIIPPSGNKSGTLFQGDKRTDALGFYSQAERTIDEKMGAKAKSGDVLKMLQGTPGVKPDELHWSGLNDLLADPGKMVTKQEVLDHLRQNNVQLSEVVKSDSPDVSAIDAQIADLHEQQEALNEKLQPDYDRIEQELNAAKRRFNIADRSRDGASPEDYDAYEKAQSDYYDDKAAIDEHHGENSVEREIEQLEQQKRDLAENSETKFDKYQVPGGKNYQEWLLTLPNKDADIQAKRLREHHAAMNELADAGLHRNATPYQISEVLGWDAANRINDAQMTTPENVHMVADRNYVSPHWDEPNVLAHVRMSDRTGPNGEKILHVEEIQSDWHQSGRKSGYKEPGGGFALPYKAVPHDGYFEVQDANGRFINNVMQHEGFPTPESAIAEARRRVNEDPRNVGGMTEAEKVPAAPFAKTWHELAVKRILRHAAENGYDKVAWTPGEIQNDRYSLHHQVDEVHYNEDSQELKAYKNGALQPVVRKDGVKPNDLPDLIGKEAAERIMDQTPTRLGVRSLEGEQLKVGGFGMKGFYDKILPDTFNKLGKRFGAKVGETSVRAGDIRFDPGTAKIIKRGNEYQVWADGKLEGHFPTEPDAQKFATDGGSKATLHSIDITPDMRRSLTTEGQPLFQPDAAKQDATEGNRMPPKGSIEFKKDETAIIRGLHNPDISTAIHELWHYSRRQWARWFPSDDAFLLNHYNSRVEAAHDAGTISDRDYEAHLADRAKGDTGWTTATEEMHANDGERYFHDGIAPTKALARIFANIKEWMGEVYHGVQGTRLAQDIHPDVRAIFDKQFGKGGAKDLAERGETPHGETVAEKPAGETRGVPSETKPPGVKGGGAVDDDKYIGSINRHTSQFSPAIEKNVRAIAESRGLIDKETATDKDSEALAKSLNLSYADLEHWRAGDEPRRPDGITPKLWTKTWNHALEMLHHAAQGDLIRAQDGVVDAQNAHDDDASPGTAAVLQKANAALKDANETAANIQVQTDTARAKSGAGLQGYNRTPGAFRGEGYIHALETVPYLDEGLRGPEAKPTVPGRLGARLKGEGPVVPNVPRPAPAMRERSVDEAGRQAASRALRQGQDGGPMKMFQGGKDSDEISHMNPSGGLFGDYNPESRQDAKLAKNITTYDKIHGIGPQDKVTIYRGAPSNQSTLAPGDFVTTHPQLAKDYAGTGRVIKQEVPASHILADSDDPEGEEFIYRPAPANARIPARTAAEAAAAKVDNKSPKTLFQGGNPQTETPEFKRWFGESKIVDENGKPLVVYHGTTDDFNTFKPSPTGIHFGTAEQANVRSRGNRLIPAYVNIEHPVRLIDRSGSWSKDQIANAKRNGADGIVYLNRYEGLDSANVAKAHDAGIDVNRLSDAAFKKQFPESRDSYIAFDPKQIKSAIGNRGTFDPNDANILHQPAADDDLDSRWNQDWSREALTRKGMEFTGEFNRTDLGHTDFNALPDRQAAAVALGKFHYESGLRWHDDTPNPWRVAMEKDIGRPMSDTDAKRGYYLTRGAVAQDVKTKQEEATAPLFKDQLRELGRLGAAQFVHDISPETFNKIVAGHPASAFTDAEKAEIAHHWTANLPDRAKPTPQSKSVAKAIADEMTAPQRKAEASVRAKMSAAARKVNAPAKDPFVVAVGRRVKGGEKAAVQLKLDLETDAVGRSAVQKLTNAEDLTDREGRRLAGAIEASKRTNAPPDPDAITARLTKLVSDARRGRLGYDNPLVEARAQLVAAAKRPVDRLGPHADPTKKANAQAKVDAKIAKIDVDLGKITDPHDVKQIARVLMKHSDFIDQYGQWVLGDDLSSPDTFEKMSFAHVATVGAEEMRRYLFENKGEIGKGMAAGRQAVRTRGVPEAVRILKEGPTAAHLAGQSWYRPTGGRIPVESKSILHRALVLRPHAAFYQLMQTYNTERGLHMFADGAGRARGLSGDDLDNFIMDVRLHPERYKDLAENAIEFGQEETQTNANGLVKKISHLTEGNPALQIGRKGFLPVANIPLNALVRSIETQTGLLSAPALARMYEWSDKDATPEMVAAYKRKVYHRGAVGAGIGALGGLGGWFGGITPSDPKHGRYAGRINLPFTKHSLDVPAGNVGVALDTWASIAHDVKMGQYNPLTMAGQALRPYVDDNPLLRASETISGLVSPLSPGNENAKTGNRALGNLIVEHMPLSGLLGWLARLDDVVHGGGVRAGIEAPAKQGASAPSKGSGPFPYGALDYPVNAIPIARRKLLQPTRDKLNHNRPYPESFLHVSKTLTQEQLAAEDRESGPLQSKQDQAALARWENSFKRDLAGAGKR